MPIFVSSFFLPCLSLFWTGGIATAFGTCFLRLGTHGIWTTWAFRAFMGAAALSRRRSFFFPLLFFSPELSMGENRAPLLCLLVTEYDVDSAIYRSIWCVRDIRNISALLIQV